MPGDLPVLPPQLQRSARVDDNGEVSWPDVDAKDAVNALAHAGLVVLGLDVRFYDDAGRFYEVPWSSFEPDPAASESANVDAGRRAALAALANIDSLETPEDTTERRVLVTWR